MRMFIKSKGLVQAVAFLFALGVSGGVFAADVRGSRVMPMGKVSIYDGADKIGELSSEAPLPANRILVSDQRCAVKLPGIFLVAEENTRFAVRPISDGHDIFVQDGTLYFALGILKDTLTFSTPKETLTVQSVVMTASTASPVVKGYVSYIDDKMEIGVIEGGHIMVTNASGQQLIESGSGLTVLRAQAQLGAPGGTAGSGVKIVIASAVAAGALTAGIAAMGGFDSSDDQPPTSPFEP